VEVAPGTTIGPYRVESPLAAGGMGAVFLATDTALDRPVALKVIAPQLAGDERFRRRFLLESKLAARLDHPAIVPVHFAGQSDGRLYLVMRFVDGPSLADILEREGRLPVARAIALLRPIADALDAAHAAGLVHRDVKPGNVLIEEGPRGPRPFLCDFGLARASATADSLSREDGLGVSGTTAYLAPEQIEGDPVTALTDEYGLACVLFETLAGRPPFARDDQLSVVYAHLTEPPPSLSSLRPEFPAAIDAVLARGLAKVPGDRYPGCTALIEAAAEALDAPAAAPHAPGPEPAGRDRTHLLATLHGLDAVRRREGDDAAAALVRRFGNAIENAAAVYDGIVVETRETSAAAAFDHPALAIQAATAIQRGADSLGDGVGIGLDSTEAVAARLAARAGAREVLGTEFVVHTASAVPGATWHDLGTERVPGLPDALHLYSIHPERDRGRAPSRRRPVLIGAAAALLITAAVAIVALAGRGGGGGHTASPPPAGAPLTPAAATPLASVSGVDPGSGQWSPAFAAGTTPDGLAYAGGQLWVINADDKTLSHIDPKTGTAQTVGDLHVPIAIASGLGALWVATGTTPDAIDEVVKLDPVTGGLVDHFPIPAGKRVGFNAFDVLAVESAAAWIANADGSLIRLDVQSGAAKVVAGVTANAVSATPGGIVAVGPRTLWMLSADTGDVYETIPVNTRGLGEAVADAEGGIWAVDTADGKVWHITPGPVRDSSTISGGEYGRMSYDGSRIWITDAIAQTLTRIDTATGATKSYNLATTPQAIAVGGGRIWVAGTSAANRGPTVASPPCGRLETAAGQAPTLVITSDLPLQASDLGGVQMADAIRARLAAHGFRAGKYAVGYQSCDSSSPTLFADPLKCLANARNYAATPAVIGVIGSLVSKCSALELPILNSAAGGPVAMISPNNTNDDLTYSATFGSPDIARRYYPTGRRNYARLQGSDAAEAAAIAEYTRQHIPPPHYVIVIHSASDYGRRDGALLASATQAVDSGIGSEEYDGTAASLKQIRQDLQDPPNAVLLAAFPDDPGTADVIAAIRSTAPSVPIVAMDGFTSVDFALQSVGPAARGMIIATPGLPNDHLPPAGTAFVQGFAGPGRSPVVPFSSVYGAQAADVLLDAIARSDGTRSSVARELTRTHIRNGLLGSFTIDPSGDIDPSTFSFYKITASKPSGAAGTFDGAAYLTSLSVPAVTRAAGG
jgi:hypothetical protein